MKAALGAMLAASLLATPARAQSSSSWSDVPDRFQIDTGYFHLTPTTVLRYSPSDGAPAGSVDFENDLGLDDKANTFWVDGTWRVGRRHLLKLSYTKLSRKANDHQLTRTFDWGGETYTAGLDAATENSTRIVGGYYRFAVVRNDRFEIGPTVGIGYLSLEARIRTASTLSGSGGQSGSRTIDRSASTDSPTGAVGAYANGWATKRLMLEGDFLYIKVKPEDSEAAVTDWRIGANYYFLRKAGVGVQYKFYRYSYDRGVVSSKLGGEITYDGVQAYATFRF